MGQRNHTLQRFHLELYGYLTDECGWLEYAAAAAALNRANMILFPAIIMSMEIKLKHSFNLERKFILNELTFERIKNQFRAQTCVFYCRNMFHSFAGMMADGVPSSDPGARIPSPAIELNSD